ncbi:MAG: leucine-rich repeat protein [Prevotella sp.]|nr:leucine-rich repeat protein [Prevotella sp.]
MKAIRILLTLFAALLLSANAKAEDVTIDDINYQLNEDGTATVTYGDYSSKTSITIPETVTYIDDTYTVTKIGSAAFTNCTRLKIVDLPSTLTNIEGGAFYGTTLTALVCRAVTPPTTSNFPRPVFPSNISTTLLYVPMGCLDAYGSSDWGAFGKIFEITTVVDGIQYLLTVGKREATVIASATNASGDLVIPGTFNYQGLEFTVTNIYDGVYQNNKQLLSVTIGEGVTTIGASAFYGCTGIKKMVLPSTMETIEGRALAGLSNLKTLFCYAETPPTVERTTFNSATTSNHTLFVPEGSVSTYQNKNYWKNFAFIKAISSTATIDGITYSLDANTGTATVIEGDYADLTAVNIPETVTYENITFTVTAIADEAFMNCTHFSTLTLPSTLKTIGARAFKGCYFGGLLDIPEGVTEIGESAFETCFNVHVLIIPSTLTTLGEKALYCPNLNQVISHLQTPLAISGEMFSRFSATLYVPEEAQSAYEAADVWQDFHTITPGYANVTYTGGLYYIYYGNQAKIIDPLDFDNDYAGDVVVPETITAGEQTYTVTSVGVSAFCFCMGLTSVTLPETVTTIEHGAFSGSTNLTSVNIPSGVTTIPYSAFYHCSGLTEITIPEGVTYIDESAFEGCTGLTEITIPASTDVLGTTVFKDCTGLTTVYILPTQMTYFDKAAFSGCENITTVYCYLETPKTLNTSAFPSRGTATLYVPEGSVEAYQGADIWSEFAHINAIVNTVTIDGINYRLNADGTATVVAGDYADLTAVNIPETVTNGGEDFTVTGIQRWAFMECEALTSVTLSPYMTTLERGTFYGCTNLTDITIPEGVTTIEQFALCGCTSLTSITIPESVTSIEIGAFNECPLTEIYSYATTPPSVESDNAFSCYNTATLHVPAGCVEAYQGANIWSNFANIVEMSSTVTIDGINYRLNADGTATVITGQYSGDITIPDTFTSNGRTYTVTAVDASAFRFKNITSITLPETLTSIGSYAFANTNITSLTIPEGITALPNDMCSGCGSMEILILPSTLTSIGENAFHLCYNLGMVISHAQTPPAVEENTFFSATDATLYVPEGCTSDYQADPYWSQFNIIEGNAYMAEIDGLKYLLYDNQATVIKGEYAALTSVNIPQTITRNGITYTVTAIGNKAFQSCTQLTSATLPSSIITVGEFAFSSCPLTSISLPEGLTTIGKSAFSYCQDLTAITLPESLTTLGDDAFANCLGLSSVVIPQNVTSIGHSVFAATGLISIQVASGNTTYDSRNGCNAIIETVSNTLIQGCSTTIIPQGTTAIGQSAFNGFSALTAIAIPSGVTSIDDYAFMNCNTLAEVDLPSTLTTIGVMAFEGAVAMTSLTIPSSVTTIGDCAFRSLGLTSLVIPEGVTSIGREAFGNCTALESVTIPSTVTSFGWYMFNNCDNLSSVYCYLQTPPTLDSGGITFPSRSTATLYVPAGCVEAYSNAPIWEDFNRILEIGTLSGDVDGDGVVDVADFTVLAKYLLGIPLFNFNIQAADVAGGPGGTPDGAVDVADLTGIANIILHSGNASGAPRKSPALIPTPALP